MHNRSRSIIKSAMVSKYTKEKTNAGIRYKGEEVRDFFQKTEKLYKREGFGDKAKFGLVVKAIKTDKKMLEFDLVCGSNSYDEVKNSCIVYESNQKLHASSLNYVNDEDETEMELEVEKLRKQVEEMRLMLARQSLGSSQDR